MAHAITLDGDNLDVSLLWSGARGGGPKGALNSAAG